MKDILVLVTLQPLLRVIQKYILEEDRARVDIQYCKNLNGIIDFIDKKLPSSVEVIISTPARLSSSRSSSRKKYLFFRWNITI